MTTADLYRKEWATLTGRPESDIYTPEALRGEKGDDEAAPGRAPVPTDLDVREYVGQQGSRPAQRGV